MIAGSESVRPSPELLRVFEQELASRLEQLRLQRDLLEHDRQRPVQELRRAAHSIKGAAAVVGEDELRALAGALEREAAADRPQLAWIDDLLDALGARVAAFAAGPASDGQAAVGADTCPARPAAGEEDALVLQIDDDATIRALVERIFATRSVRVLAAETAEEGVELACRHRPSLILLDLNLRDADGGQVLRQLKERPETCRLPVVVLSGEDDERRQAELLELGARGYLTKPFRIAELLALFDEVVAEHGADPVRGGSHDG